MSVASILLPALLALGAPAQDAAPATPKPPGKTWFYLRMWPDLLAKYDPETDQVVATAKSRHGTGYDFDVMWDRKRILQVTGQRAFVEIVDLATMEVVEEHSFERDGFIVRVNEIREIPGGDRWYVRLDEVEKKLDHFVVDEPKWAEYDLEERKLGKRMKELPKAIRRGARVSPDGTKWHVFGKDFTVVDPKTLKEEGKIELSKPLFSGLGPMSLRGDDFFDRRNPEWYRFVYAMRDPVNKKRTLVGLVDLDLKAMKIASHVEWGAMPRVGGWTYSADRTVAVGQAREGPREGQAEGRDPEITLYSFDLRDGKKIKETRVEVRNGLHIVAVSPDGSKIYLAGRGDELVVYGREHQHLKTVRLPAEFDGWIIVASE